MRRLKAVPPFSYEVLHTYKGGPTLKEDKKLNVVLAGITYVFDFLYSLLLKYSQVVLVIIVLYDLDGIYFHGCRCTKGTAYCRWVLF